MIKLALLIFAVVVFALVAFTVIDSNVMRWEAGALAAFAAAFLPWPNITTGSPGQPST